MNDDLQALAKKWRDIYGAGAGNMHFANRCADELEAALAQQGRDTGGRTCCDRAYKDGYDTGKMHAAPKQQAVEVTDELCIALDDYLWEHHDISVGKEAMRAALLAALPGKTEVDRG